MSFYLLLCVAARKINSNQFRSISTKSPMALIILISILSIHLDILSAHDSSNHFDFCKISYYLFSNQFTCHCCLSCSYLPFSDEQFPVNLMVVVIVAVAYSLR